MSNPRSKRKTDWVMWLIIAVGMFPISFLIVRAGCRWIAASEFDVARVTFVGVCSQILLGVCGILFVYFQIRKMAKNSRQQLIWNMRVESLRKTAEHREIAESFMYLKKYRQAYPNDRGYLMKSIPTDLDDNESRHVCEILNYFETIEAGIKYQVYDDAIMYDNFNGMALDVFCCAEEFIRAKRSKRVHPDTWTLFEGMAERWDRKRRQLENKAKEAAKAAKNHDKVEDIM